MAPVNERLGLHRDACNTLDARRRAHGNEREETSHGYHPYRGGRYNGSEDQSPSPDTCRDLRPLVDTSSTPSSHHGTDSRPTSRNTLGKQTPDYGSRIIGLLAKPVEQIVTISLSATFHCSWSIRCERGWNTFRPTESKVGRT